MDARIVEFAEVLRQNGVRVSTPEVGDAARATALVGLADKDLFRAVLRSTLIKREQDGETFQRAFEAFFSGAARTLEAIEPSLAERLAEQGLLSSESRDRLREELRQRLPDLSPLTRAIVQGDRAALAHLLRTAQLQVNLSRMGSALQQGYFSRRLLLAAGLEQARAELQSLEGALRARGLAGREAEVVSRQLAEALRRVEDAARREVRRQGDARLRPPSSAAVDKPLHRLSQAEVKQMRAAVRALAEKLKARLVRKRRSRRQGTLHVRRTLRRNLSWGGVPLVLQFRAHRPERPELVVLCDVSDSVRNASRMMLLFTYTLQTLFSRVRSFVFVAEVGEVTRLFRERDVDRAIDLATLGDAVSLTAHSDYGRVLSTFTRHQLGSLTRRTTVMIIGDGRTNHQPAEAWALDEVRRKCKRLLWVCPEPRENWGTGDSEMLTYAKHCHHAVVVNSVAALSRLAGELVPT